MGKKRKEKLDAFHWHEALDRSFLAFEFFDEYVSQHPTILGTKQLKKEAREISQRMFRLYQKLGSMASDRE